MERPLELTMTSMMTAQSLKVELVLVAVVEEEVATGALVARLQVYFVQYYSYYYYC